VEGLVAVLEAVEDVDRLLDRRLADEHRLEAALERRVLLDVPAVLVQRGRADHVQLAAGECGLEHVRGVHRPLGGPRAHDGVQLVDEHDQLLGRAPDLVDHGLEPLLELAAVFRPGDHPSQVESDDAPVGERLGNLVVDDALCDTFDDRGLAHARLAEQGRVVLRPAGEDFDRLIDLVRAPDDGVELALACLLRQIAAILVESRSAAHLPGTSRRLDAADHAAAELRVRGAEALEQSSGFTVVVTRERKQHVLGADIRSSELARLVVGSEQRRLPVRRERGRDVRPLRLLGLLLDLGCDRVRVGVDLAQHMADDIVAKGRMQEMVGVEVEASPLERRLRRALQQLAGGVAEELGDVDPFNLPGGCRDPPRRWCLPEEVGEELVEQAAAAEAARHPLFGEIELAEILGFLRPVRTKPDPGGDCRSPVTLAKVLDGHLNPLSLGQ
jgi:hypothetical protein